MDSEGGRRMHELSITEHLLEYCMEEAHRQNVSKIRTINVCIGQLRGIIPDCIQVYLDMLSEGTIAEGAKLKAKLLPVMSLTENLFQMLPQNRLNLKIRL